MSAAVMPDRSLDRDCGLPEIVLLAALAVVA